MHNNYDLFRNAKASGFFQVSEKETTLARVLVQYKSKNENKPQNLPIPKFKRIRLLQHAILLQFVL